MVPDALLRNAALGAAKAHRRSRSGRRAADALLHSLARFLSGAIEPLPPADEAAVLDLCGGLRAARLCRFAIGRCGVESRRDIASARLDHARSDRLLLRLL